MKYYFDRNVFTNPNKDGRWIFVHNLDTMNHLKSENPNMSLFVFNITAHKSCPAQLQQKKVTNIICYPAAV